MVYIWRNIARSAQHFLQVDRRLFRCAVDHSSSCCCWCFSFVLSLHKFLHAQCLPPVVPKWQQTSSGPFGVTASARLPPLDPTSAPDAISPAELAESCPGPLTAAPHLFFGGGARQVQNPVAGQASERIAAPRHMNSLKGHDALPIPTTCLLPLAIQLGPEPSSHCLHAHLGVIICSARLYINVRRRRHKHSDGADTYCDTHSRTRTLFPFAIG